MSDYKQRESHFENGLMSCSQCFREDLIPAMMTNKQAMMVLNAGKSINFLNEICGHKMEIKGARAKLRFMEDSEGCLLYTSRCV